MKWAQFGWATGALATTMNTDYVTPLDEDQVWSIWGRQRPGKEVMMNAFFSANALTQEALSPREVKFYLFVAAFVAGNLVFPALVHTVPRGGLIFLPIYFFTLIAAYRFGLLAGLATALVSPLANHLLTGMPPLLVLDAIVVKSTALALVAALAAKHLKLPLVVNLVLVVIGYQLLGGAYEVVKAGNIQAALGDWVLGWPGLVIQLVVGALVLGLWPRGDKGAGQTAR